MRWAVWYHIADQNYSVSISCHWYKVLTQNEILCTTVLTRAILSMVLQGIVFRTTLNSHFYSWNRNCAMTWSSYIPIAWYGAPSSCSARLPTSVAPRPWRSVFSCSVVTWAKLNFKLVLLNPDSVFDSHACGSGAHFVVGGSSPSKPCSDAQNPNIPHDLHLDFTLKSLKSLRKSFLLLERLVSWRWNAFEDINGTLFIGALVADSLLSRWRAPAATVAYSILLKNTSFSNLYFNLNNL